MGVIAIEQYLIKLEKSMNKESIIVLEVSVDTIKNVKKIVKRSGFKKLKIYIKIYQEVVEHC